MLHRWLAQIVRSPDVAGLLLAAAVAVSGGAWTLFAYLQESSESRRDEPREVVVALRGGGDTPSVSDVPISIFVGGRPSVLLRSPDGDRDHSGEEQHWEQTYAVTSGNAGARGQGGSDIAPAEAMLAVALEQERAGTKKRQAELLRQIGAIARGSNRTKATAAYGESTDLDPENAFGWVMLGHLLMESGHFADARRAYEHVVSLGQGAHDPSLLVS